MLNKEDSFDFDFYGSGAAKSRRYHFYCIVCKEAIMVRSCKLPTHSGKCFGCSLSDRTLRPFEAKHNSMLARHYGKNMKGTPIAYEEYFEFSKTKSCHYCDRILNWSCGRGSEDKTGRGVNLDRLDSSIGYCSGNLVACCWSCNQIKSDHVPYEAMLEIGPILAKYNVFGRKQGREGIERIKLTPEQRASVSASRSTSRNKAGYRGIHLRKSNQKWCAQIRILGKNTSLGCYNTKEEAAYAYDKKAKYLYGPAATLNFPDNID